jgi:hypothetical protein
MSCRTYIRRSTIIFLISASRDAAATASGKDAQTRQSIAEP